MCAITFMMRIERKSIQMLDLVQNLVRCLIDRMPFMWIAERYLHPRINEIFFRTRFQSHKIISEYKF